MSFSFKNWKSFREYMKHEGITVARFDFDHYQCRFEIIYSPSQNLFWVAKRGSQIAFPIYLDWYKAAVILEKEPYRALASCKEEAFDPNRPYSPFDFLKKLDDHLGTKPRLQQATPQAFYHTTRNAIPDEEKVYFQRFIPHKPGTRHVRGANIAKTRKILGDAIADFCKEHNVSVGFTSQPTERSYEIIVDPEKVLEKENV